MAKKKILQKEIKSSKYEFQLKVKANIKESDLYKLGANKLGTIIQEDKYFIPKLKTVSETDELIRIRKEGGEDLLFTYFPSNKLKDSEKYKIINKKIRKSEVAITPIQKKQIVELKKEYNEIVNVNKKRTIFVLGSVIINLDKVEKLGNFIEFKVQKEKDSYLIDKIIKQLGLDWENSMSVSYFELSLINISPFQRLAVKIHEKLGGFSFGISSAVLTTLGIVIGLNSATESLTAVMGGIAAVAIADSLADAMGMYASKKSERGSSTTSAFKSASNVFFGKFIFALTFLIPFFILPFIAAIYACIFWGLILLTFVSIQIAFIQEEDIPASIIKNLSIACGVILLSYLVGKGVSLIS
jgi:vacuolar iron transporter family protein